MNFFNISRPESSPVLKKVYAIMRLTTLALIAFSLNISATVYSQKTKLSLDVNNQSIKEILFLIENQSEFRFIYESGKINLDKKVSVREKEQTVETILNRLFTKEGIRYEITENNLILINPAEKEIRNLQQQKQKTIMGVVMDTNGLPVIGANVVEKGTTNGVITDLDGNFSLEISINASLEISYIGYLSQTIKVGNNTQLQVTLHEDTQNLDEIVVTALGIKRDKKALGYSTQDLKAEELLESRTSSLANTLVGKVAGAQISESGIGMGGSTRVIIRGSSSLSGNNQPLWVVDGIPIDDSQPGSVSDDWGGSDRAGMASQLNPDDIESISILKGPSASALYGSRAGNGVVLVTTKKGSTGKWTVSLNSNFTSEVIAYTPEYQNTYGQGSNGVYNVESDASWGPVMDGKDVVNFRGNEVPFSAQKNREKDFFNNGTGFTNTIALSGGNDISNVRLSFNDSRNKGLTPKHSLNRTGIDLSGSLTLWKKLKLSTKANYITERVENAPSTGHYSTMNQFLLMPRNIRIADLSPSRVNEQHINFIPNNAFNFNPMFGPEWNNSFSTTNRLLGYISADWEITKELSLSGKTGMDFYAVNGESKSYPTEPSRFRTYSTSQSNFREHNSDILLKYAKTFGKYFIGANVGGSIMYRKISGISVTSPNQKGPDFFSLSNGSNIQASESKSEKKIQSVYGMLNLGYDDYIYLDITARNDWSSTLPQDNWSFFYPSFSLSYIPTEMFLKMGKSLPDWLTYAKLRGSWAQVGNDTDPYRLASIFTISPRGTNGATYARYPTQIPLSNLKPEITSSYEFGTDVRLFNNRFGIDFTYYKGKTKNQILSLNVGVISGANTKLVNAGEVQNQGVELMINAIPVQTNNFTWDLTLNYSKNKNKVIELADGIPYWRIGKSEMAEVRAYPGEPFGELYARTFKRNENNQILVGDDGSPIIETVFQRVGNINPDWLGSIINDFKYKNLGLKILIDGRFGGKVMSFTESIINANGNGKRTENREDIIVPGVKKDGAQNTTPISAQSYWQTVSGAWGRYGIADEYLYDATFVKLRELSLSYVLPKKWLSPIAVRNAVVSFQARNLFYIYRATPGTNPEGAQGRLDSVQGYEFMSTPETRSFGFNINVTF